MSLTPLHACALPGFTSAHLPLRPPAAEDPSSPISFESVPSSSDYPSEAVETKWLSEMNLEAADDTSLHIKRYEFLYDTIIYFAMSDESQLADLSSWFFRAGGLAPPGVVRQ